MLQHAKWLMEETDEGLDWPLHSIIGVNDYIMKSLDDKDSVVIDIRNSASAAQKYFCSYTDSIYNEIS